MLSLLLGVLPLQTLAATSLSEPFFGRRIIPASMQVSVNNDITPRQTIHGNKIHLHAWLMETPHRPAWIFDFLSDANDAIKQIQWTESGINRIELEDTLVKEGRAISLHVFVRDMTACKTLGWTEQQCRSRRSLSPLFEYQSQFSLNLSPADKVSSEKNDLGAFSFTNLIDIEPNKGFSTLLRRRIKEISQQTSLQRSALALNSFPTELVFASAPYGIGAYPGLGHPGWNTWQRQITRTDFDECLSDLSAQRRQTPRVKTPAKRKAEAENPLENFRQLQKSVAMCRKQQADTDSDAYQKILMNSKFAQTGRPQISSVHEKQLAQWHLRLKALEDATSLPNGTLFQSCVSSASVEMQRIISDAFEKLPPRVAADWKPEMVRLVPERRFDCQDRGASPDLGRLNQDPRLIGGCWKSSGKVANAPMALHLLENTEIAQTRLLPLLIWAWLDFFVDTLFVPAVLQRSQMPPAEFNANELLLFDQLEQIIRLRSELVEAFLSDLKLAGYDTAIQSMATALSVDASNLASQPNLQNVIFAQLISQFYCSSDTAASFNQNHFLRTRWALFEAAEILGGRWFETPK
jgi:hypothetical protein